MYFAFTCFCTFTLGQIEHGALHLYMPAFTLLGLVGEGSGSFALMSLSPLLGGLLKALRGGLGEIDFMWGLAVITLQCFLSILGTESKPFDDFINTDRRDLMEQLVVHPSIKDLKLVKLVF